MQFRLTAQMREANRCPYMTHCNILLLKGKLSCIGKMWVIKWMYNHSGYARKYGGDSYV